MLLAALSWGTASLSVCEGADCETKVIEAGRSAERTDAVKNDDNLSRRCYACLSGDTLSVGNALIERAFLWNGGNVVNAYVKDKRTGRVFVNGTPEPALAVGQPFGKAPDGRLEVREVKSDGIHPKHLEAEVMFSMGGIRVRRVIRVYENCPAIACDNYAGGLASVKDEGLANSADNKNIESTDVIKRQKESKSRHLEMFSPGGMHWQVKTVEFFDVTDWRKDADAVVKLYKEYGIKVFKIDGVSIPTKRAEMNLRRFFDTVLAETGNEAVFNLDVTAGRRGGYHFFNEYGNIFLENRYTDWRNYYPYWTLRNLWQLSRYVPAEKLQVEFLNKWRNADEYADDPFAPSSYSFRYIFATAMAGQPLAWMEASNLPEEAFRLSSVIKAYKAVMNDFHDGTVLPIGEEPSGKSWTGFQSISSGEKTGFMLVFREKNEYDSARLDTWLPEGISVHFTPVTGSGSAFDTVTGRNGAVEFALSSENSFALYEYEIR